MERVIASRFLRRLLLDCRFHVGGRATVSLSSNCSRANHVSNKGALTGGSANSPAKVAPDHRPTKLEVTAVVTPQCAPAPCCGR